MANGQHKRINSQAVLFVGVAIVVALLILTAQQRTAEHRAVQDAPVSDLSLPDTTCHLRPFDPNTVSYEELLSLGMSRREAVSLIKFRASGKVFRIAEDVALCYELTDSAYQVLKPYINIGDSYRLHPRNYAERSYQKRERDSVVLLALPRFGSTPYRPPTSVPSGPSRNDRPRPSFVGAIGAVFGIWRRCAPAMWWRIR